MVATKENQGQFVDERFEFIFYINNHIICQRFFNIKNFNEDSLVSLEIKDMLDSIGGMKNGKATASIKQGGVASLVTSTAKGKTGMKGSNPYS